MRPNTPAPASHRGTDAASGPPHLAAVIADGGTVIRQALRIACDPAGDRT